MAKKVIVIDGYIGASAYSKQWVRQMLTGSENSEINIPISSLGGEVDHALNIHDQFASHGNITVDYTGFNASSATVIGLGAKKTRMSSNSFYLIHKVMSWIDEFGYMNEDDLDALIQRLETEKNENAKITLQLAKMYANKSGKSAKDILDLMKKQTWLTADEAKEWGFVDEVYQPVTKENYLDNIAKVAMISAAGFPTPTRKVSVINDTNKIDEDNFFDKMYNRLKKAINNKEPMKKQFLNVNKALKVDKLESTDEGVFLNEEQLESIEASLTAANQAETERDAARTEVTNTLTTLDTIDPTIAAAKTAEDKVKAIQAYVAKKPGANSAEVNKETDANEGGSPNEDDNFWNRFSKLKNEIKPK
jgi:ATP-dependent Clp protease, protease subunit